MLPFLELWRLKIFGWERIYATLDNYDETDHATRLKHFSMLVGMFTRWGWDAKVRVLGVVFTKRSRVLCEE